jgi:hypothetical protein
MTIHAIQRRMLFVVERDLPLVFSQSGHRTVNRRFVWLGFTFHVPHIFFADADMASGALFIGCKSVFAVMTRAAVPALVERIHNKILFLLGKQSLHFKQAAVAFLTTYFFYIHMMLMAENNGFHRLRIQNATAVGKTAFSGRTDIGDAEKSEKNYKNKISFHC